MARLRTAIVVFDGFRGCHDDGLSPVPSLEAALGTAVATHWNCWTGPGDSLADRFDRVLSWLDAESQHVAEVHLVALSMGCQLAARFGAHVLARTPSIEIGQVLLIAPDPKYRPVERDATETAAGVVSAYDETVALWGDASSDDHPIVSTLKAVARRATKVSIVYSRADGVAQWEDNVELMITELRSVKGVELIEARDGDIVVEHDVIVDLESTDRRSDVHERLWTAVRLEPRS